MKDFALWTVIVFMSIDVLAKVILFGAQRFPIERTAASAAMDLGLNFILLCLCIVALTQK